MHNYSSCYGTSNVFIILLPGKRQIKPFGKQTVFFETIMASLPLKVPLSDIFTDMFSHAPLLVQEHGP